MKSKAAVLSISSGCLLVAFIMMVNVSDDGVFISSWVDILIHITLAVLTFGPVISSKMISNDHRDDLLGELVDVHPPQVEHFSFPVPSHKNLVSVQKIPVSMLVVLGLLVAALAFTGQAFMDMFLATGMDFEVLMMIAAVPGSLIFLILIAFIAVTVREGRLRRNFRAEIEEGLSKNGFCLGRDFRPELVGDRHILLRDEENNCLWWNLAFHDGSAKLDWAGNTDKLDTHHPEEAA